MAARVWRDGGSVLVDAGQQSADHLAIRNALASDHPRSTSCMTARFGVPLCTPVYAAAGGTVLQELLQLRLR